MEREKIYFVERNNADKKKFKVAHPWDGRFTPLNPDLLLNDAKALSLKLDIRNTDYILGFAEGGLLPAFALSAVTGLPMIGSYRVRCKLENEIKFVEPHSERANHYIYGLKKNDRVIIIEDEITTGDTIFNAKNSLENAGVEVVDIGTLILAEQRDKTEKNEDKKELLSQVKFLHYL